MEELQSWFLIMLYLHEQAIPQARGGNPSFYARIMNTWHGDTTNYATELRACSQVIHLYEAANPPTAILSSVRQAFNMDDPPLVEELPIPPRLKKRSGMAVLFELTDAGRLQAQGLVADLSENCQEAIKGALIEQHHTNRRFRRMD